MFDTRTRLSYFACQQKNRLRLSNTVIDAVSFSFSGQLWGMFHSLDPREGPTCLRGVSPKEYACSMSNTSFLSHVFLSLFLLSLILYAWDCMGNKADCCQVWATGQLSGYDTDAQQETDQEAQVG